MKLLVLLFAIEAGIVPRFTYPGVGAELWQLGYVQLETEGQLLNNHLFIGGSVKTFITPTDHLTFSPRFAEYDFSAGIRFGLFEAGLRHRCTHNIEASMPILIGYDEIYLRISNEKQK